MNLNDFDHVVLNGFSARIADFPSLDLRNTYYDILQICTEIASLEQGRPSKILFSETASDVEKQSAIYRDRLISVLLKSSYMLVDIFISKFAGALHQRSWMSMSSFLSNGNPRFSNLTEDELLPAYCVAIYRNKLVAHYDYRRMGGYSISAEGVQTLSPLPDAFNISKEDVAELQRLQRKYQSAIPFLREIENHFKLLNALFYNLPLGHVGQPNPDRAIVNRIAERGGCESRSAQDLITAIDSFCVGALRCLS